METKLWHEAGWWRWEVKVAGAVVECGISTALAAAERALAEAAARRAPAEAIR